MHAPISGPPLLVGRDRELATLTRHLDAVLTGHGSLALIAGEAGIGKTALAEALTREAITRGAQVLTGHAYDLTETSPYGLWIDLFRRYDPDAGGPSLPDAFSQRG